jgi:flagellar biosynthetic protein FliP
MNRLFLMLMLLNFVSFSVFAAEGSLSRAAEGSLSQSAEGSLSRARAAEGSFETAVEAITSSPGRLGIPALTFEESETGGTYTVTLQILFIMTALTLLPSIVMMMTAFTRIIVVFAILRQALGLQQTPSNQILIGLALFLSIFVMSPVLEQANKVALQPYLQEKMAPLDAVKAASEPFRQFMLAQTREDDLALFLRISSSEKPNAPEDVSFFVLAPAFVTSELKTAFQIGFLLFIPFLVIDLVVASVLMSMGMMMLSPIIISLPFKLMLFILIDGWAMIIGSLAGSFGMG